MSEETVLDASSADISSSSGPVDSAPQSPSGESSGGQADGGGSNVWSSFRALPDFQGQDDTQIAGRLYASLEREKAATKALQQYQQLIPYAQEYLTHRDAFDQWRQYQGQPQQQPQAPAPQAVQPEQHKWWNPPELKDSDRRYLVKDANGRDSIAEGAPLHSRERLMDYMQYRADFAQKFLSDPQAALGPMVEQVAAERAREIVQEQIREVSEASYVTTLEQQNRDWLYETDGKTPSREGLMIQKYIGQAAQAGYGTPQERWQFACDMVERDLLREVLEQRQAAAARPAAFAQQPPAAPQAAPQQAAPAQNRAERDIEYLRREASRNPSRSGPPSDPRVPKAPMTFEQRLRAQMARDGIE
jgi:hypothetical protein